METIVQLHPVIDLDDDRFFEFCQINRDLRIERNAQGELIIMPPAGGNTSARNAEIVSQLHLWAKRDGTGTVFDSSGGFRLPNGAVRSPDASWVQHVQLETLSDEQREKFLPLCPDFLIELRSPSDELRTLQEKIQEYLENGARLGWLIDPQQKTVSIYRPQLPVETLETPRTVAGDPVLPGFILNTEDIWP